jgi:Rrf2 family protein
MLSQKSKYALKALGYLAQKYGQGPVLMSTIAQEKNIPLPFLENIFHQLKHAAILISHRGRYGGYTLASPPNEITVSQIIRLVNGPIALLNCASLNFYEPCSDCKESCCGLKNVIQEARDAVLSVLEYRTLMDIRDQ